MSALVRTSKTSVGGAADRRMVRRTRKLFFDHRWVLLALVLYTGYAVFLTWPLVTDPGGLLSGVGVSGDLGGSVSQVAYVVQHHVFPFAPAVLHGLDAPEGLAQTWVLNWASFPAVALLDALGYLAGPLPGQAIYLLLGYVLSGLAMFLLARRLFGSSGAALLAGFAFAFYPFAVDKINGHYDYMYGWVMVLMVWRMLELARRATVRNGLLGGCAAAFAMWWTPYFILIAGVGFITSAIIVLGAGWLRHEALSSLKSLAYACVPIVVLFGALGSLTLLAGTTATGSVRTQSINELYTYSARWLEWLIPDRHNLIFGHLTGGYLTAHLHGSNFSESSLYVGLSVVALAVAGAAIAAARIRVVRSVVASELPIIAGVAGVLLALVSAWFSSPPKVHVLGVWVPTPSWFIFHLTSTWRVYTRFVELLELGLCLLLALAAARLFARRRRVARPLLFGLLAAVLVLDLWARPPVRAIPVTPPAAYAWLRDHPGGIVADYPLEPAEYPDYSALFWQMIDHHPLFQGYAAGSETESMKLDFADLREPRTGPGLAALDVRYIVVHQGELGADPANLRRQGYILRFAAPDASVWQVGARPAATRVDLLSNFSPLEGGPGSEYRWMTGPGVIGAYARGCSSCVGTLTFTSNSADIQRILTVREQETGQVLSRVAVPAQRGIVVHVRGVRLVNGQARLLLSTDIPAKRPKDGDPRLLAINVLEPRLELDGRTAG